MTSAKSKAAQTGKKTLVTTDAAGNLYHDEGEKGVGLGIAGRIGSNVYLSAAGRYGLEFEKVGAKAAIALAW